MVEDSTHLKQAAHAIGSSGTHTPTNKAHRPYALRLATTADAEAIARLGSHLFEVTFGYSMPAEALATYLSESYTTAIIKNELASPQHTFLVAVSTEPVAASEPPVLAGSIIGFAQLTAGAAKTMACLQNLTKDKIELQRLYVHEQFHGSGVATALFEAAERTARGEQGGHAYEMMWLGVWEDNDKAKRFYKKMGVATKAGDKDFRLGNVVQTDEVFVKYLK